MDSRHRAEFLRFAAPGSGRGSPIVALCQLSAEITGVTGAGITMVGKADAQIGAGASDPVSARIESLQFVLGEGPCLDAHHDGRPVLVPDLAHPDERRWPAMRAEALRAGASAIFAYPIRLGAAHLGVLDLYRDRPGSLGAGQQADAVEVAGMAAQVLLVQHAAAPSGRLADGLDDDNLRYLVHQAAGILSVQLDIAVPDALDRLRAYAFAHDMPIEDVAADVASHTLYLD